MSGWVSSLIAPGVESRCCDEKAKLGWVDQVSRSQIAARRL